MNKAVTFSEATSLLLSVLALGISIWSFIDSQQASELARWSEFRAKALERLEEHRRSYSNVTCLFFATNTQSGLQDFARFKENLDGVVKSLHQMEEADPASLHKFEALLEGSNATFAKLDDAVQEIKSHLNNEQIERVNLICGNG